MLNSLNSTGLGWGWVAGRSEAGLYYVGLVDLFDYSAVFW